MHADILFNLLLLLHIVDLLASWLSAFSLLGSLTSQPDSLTDIIICKLVIDAVRSEYDKVVLFGYLEFSYVWHSFYHVRVATTIFKFSLRVTESPAHREATGQDSDRSDDKFRIRLLLLSLNLLLVKSLWGCSLINLSTSFNNTLVFLNVWRLMVSTQSSHLVSSIRW